MGISPGSADIYTAQTGFQWVDITGMAPGPATLRGTANPYHCVREADDANNVTDAPREIPGVRAQAAEARTQAATPVAVQLAGEVVAPQVPARRSGTCTPSASGTFCYVYASADGPLEFKLAEPPAHGTVTIPATTGTQVSAGYTPDPGFAGEDRFTYTATDARGLVSRPVEVAVTVAPPPAASPAATAAPGASAAASLRLVRVGRRRGRWRVVVQASAPGLLAGRLDHAGHGRALTARRVAAGVTRVSLGRLRRGRYRVRLSLDGRRAGRVAFRVS
jgi:hypothetical protein